MSPGISLTVPASGLPDAGLSLPDAMSVCRFRHNPFLLGRCFRDALPVVLPETCDAFERTGGCIGAFDPINLARPWRRLGVAFNPDQRMALRCDPLCGSIQHRAAACRSPCNRLGDKLSRPRGRPCGPRLRDPEPVEELHCNIGAGSGRFVVRTLQIEHVFTLLDPEMSALGWRRRRRRGSGRRGRPRTTGCR